MYLIVTRSFPPDLGGMQSLMWGLSRELSKNFMIKVFADYVEDHKNFDEKISFSIERVGEIKLLRKYRNVAKYTCRQPPRARPTPPPAESGVLAHPRSLGRYSHL